MGSCAWRSRVEVSRRGGQAVATAVLPNTASAEVVAAAVVRWWSAGRMQPAESWGGCCDDRMLLGIPQKRKQQLELHADRQSAEAQQYGAAPTVHVAERGSACTCSGS
jgi:hypothetical protein